MRSVRPLGAVIGGLLLLGCGDDALAPKIAALLPSEGTRGATIDVVGERLGDAACAASASSTAPHCSLSFGGQPTSDVLLWEERRVRARVPAAAPAGLIVVVVTADGRRSNAFTFRVIGSSLDGGR